MTRPDSGVRMAEAASGARSYLIDLGPEALPPVRPRDLHAAWDSARGAAISRQWGRPLLLRFARPAAAPGAATHEHGDAPPMELMLADADACCWAAAVDATVGLGSAYGLSLCLRLLALVELLPRAPWTLPMVAIGRDGADIQPALWRAAARTRLTADARFDAAALRAALHAEAALAPPAAIRPIAAPSSGARA